ncbi:uncharacterized protein M8220_007058 isoform 2-T2 [Acridotheres tristis]
MFPSDARRKHLPVISLRGYTQTWILENVQLCNLQHTGNVCLHGECPATEPCPGALSRIKDIAVTNSSQICKMNQSSLLVNSFCVPVSCWRGHGRGKIPMITKGSRRGAVLPKKRPG